MSLATAFGCEMKATWLDLSSTASAPIRFARSHFAQLLAIDSELQRAKELRGQHHQIVGVCCPRLRSESPFHHHWFGERPIHE